VSQALLQNPLLLLFLVTALGYLAGTIRIKGTGLGTAAVLFVGLAFGAWQPELDIPDIIFQLGMAIFVYTIGVRTGPAFFESFQHNGWRDIGFVMLMLFLSAFISVILWYTGGFTNATIAGMYAGSTTNTTALAGVIDMVHLGRWGGEKTIDSLVVAYTFSYPMGVLGVMLAIRIMEKWLKVDYEAEKSILRKFYPLDEDLTSRAIRIINEEIRGKKVRDILQVYGWNLVFGRVDSQAYGTVLSSWDVVLMPGDTVVLVGTKEELNAAQQILGEEATNSLIYDRKEYDIVRIFVSNPEVVGRELSALRVQEKYNAIITRIRRGDVEMLAKPDMILELGDRIRFVAHRKDIKGIQAMFGDSYHASSRIDLFSFGLGLAFGLVLGLVEFHLPGGVMFRLGAAGGPLVVGLLLGAIRRTGKIIWALPYASSVTLNQLGLTLLLAVIGVRSGGTLVQSLAGGDWLQIFAAGTLLSISSAMLSLWVGYKIIRIPYSLLLGFIANQPAILDYATDITKNRVPAIGYAFMFPISLVMKILFAQMLFLLLQ
jgi:putative transport protein